MLVYRVNEYVAPTLHPMAPSYSFADAIDIQILPTYPMDEVEIRWNRMKELSIVLHYIDSKVYYFLVDDPINNTAAYRRFKLESQDPEDHHCDYYAKPILTRFMGRFHRRLHTRRLVQAIVSSIPYDPTEIEYHHQFLRKIRREYIDDSHDRHLLQQLTEESKEIVEAEERFRPNEVGFEEAKERFQETMLFSSEMVGMGINDSHSQKNLLPADSK